MRFVPALLFALLLTPVPAAAASSVRGHDPNGHATAHVTDRSVEFRGWSVDRDAPRRRVTMLRLVDGHQVGQALTSRPDSRITRAFHASAHPGFDLRTTVTDDRHPHTVCVAARNIGGGLSRVLACVVLRDRLGNRVVDHDPFGWTRFSHRGTEVSFRGRATDPDFRSRPATVVLYLDGHPAGTVITHRVTGAHSRSVGAFSDYRVSAEASGGLAHVGCTWAVNVGPGHNALLGCARFDFKSHAADHLTRRERTMMSAVVALAKKQFHKPYRWGAEGPKAFDCSGLVQWTYRKNGYLPLRVAQDQYSSAHVIPASHARPGDLVFYYDRGIGYQPIDQTPSWDGSGVSYGSFTHT